MAHAKVVLADDMVLAGTANLDALSLRQNWELQLRIDGRRRSRTTWPASCSTATSRSRCRAVVPTGWKMRARNAFFSRLAPVL